MANNYFRVTSIFNVIFRIYMENVEFCGKTFKFFPKRCQMSVQFLYLFFKCKGVKPTSMFNKICRK